MGNYACTHTGTNCAATRASRRLWRRSRPSSLAESRVRCLRDENWRSPSDVLLAKIPTVVIDCIHIEQLELFARVGVPTSERSEPQRLILNITLWPRIAQFNLRKVEVEVRKFVLPDANYVSVTAVREREVT
ncbi:MAG: hypothetical protein DMF23_00755 [Verrucomicrobia bacterium]|nr:MAG: hypothetical protein DMF23_00755 [Verrucomicrobiota bacterium]